MPFVIPVIAVVAAAAASSAAASAIGAITVLGISLSAATVGAIAGGLAALAVTFVGSAIFGSSAKPPNNSGDATSRAQEIRSPVSPHQIIVGSARVSGTLVYVYCPPLARVGYASALFGYAAHDFAPNQILYTATVLAGHEVAFVHDPALNNTNASDPQFYGYAHLEFVTGAPGQAANAMLIRETDGQWTAAHRLQGRAALFCAFNYSVAATAPFSSAPNPTAIVDGAIVYDPRTGQDAFSTNPALIIAWYLMADFGMRCTQDEIDTPSLIAAANICDEPVELLTGTVEPRYSCNGTFALDQNPGNILDQMKACMDGGIVFCGGVWYIFAGATVAPSFAIDQDMLRGPVQVQANRAAKDSFNAVRATYIRPEGNWQATDAPVRYDQAAVAADGGTFYQNLDFPFTTSGYTVQRLMQIALRRNRAERSLTIQCNMSALQVRPWDVVTFSHASATRGNLSRDELDAARRRCRSAA